MPVSVLLSPKRASSTNSTSSSSSSPLEYVPLVSSSPINHSSEALSGKSISAWMFLPLSTAAPTADLTTEGPETSVLLEVEGVEPSPTAFPKDIECGCRSEVGLYSREGVPKVKVALALTFAAAVTLEVDFGTGSDRVRPVAIEIRFGGSGRMTTTSTSESSLSFRFLVPVGTTGTSVSSSESIIITSGVMGGRGLRALVGMSGLLRPLLLGPAFLKKCSRVLLESCFVCLETCLSFLATGIKGVHGLTNVDKVVMGLKFNLKNATKRTLTH